MVVEKARIECYIGCLLSTKPRLVIHSLTARRFGRVQDSNIDIRISSTTDDQLTDQVAHAEQIRDEGASLSSLLFFPSLFIQFFTSRTNLALIILVPSCPQASNY